MLSDFIRDCRYAWRSLMRVPVFTGTIVLMLALGIGANALIFTAVDAVLLRDAPVADPDRVVDVYTSSGNNPYGDSSYPDYFDLRDSGTFGSLAAYALVGMTLDTGSGSEPIAGALVSGNYFDLLGVRMQAGRSFAPEEDRIQTPARVAVISHALWRRSFNADPSRVGGTIQLNRNAYTVIGVAPRGFTGAMLGVATDVWVPTALQPEVDPASATLRRARGHAGRFDLRRSRGLNMVARLREGVSLRETVSRAAVVSARLQAAHPASNRNRVFTVVRIGEGRGLRTATRPVLEQLSVAVAIVLLVACVNVAGLLLARAVSRAREVAVRTAVGASRARVVRQFLAESVLLALLACLAAIGIVLAGTPLLHTFVIPDAVVLSLDWRVLAFTLATGIASSLLFGLAPVAHTLRGDTVATLRDEGGPIATGARATGLRGAFVVVQIALSVILLAAAGLFLRTLAHAYSVTVPYDLDRTIVASVSVDGDYPEDRALAAYERILSRLEALPGVAAAGAARMTVLTGGARSTAVSIDGRPIQPDQRNALGVRANIVSPRYLEAMNIRLLRGRPFASADTAGAPRVAIVTHALADRLWPKQDPLGKTLWDEAHRPHVVVGVVPDTVYTSVLERNAPPTYYVPLAQNYESGVALHVRAIREPAALMSAIREAVRQVDDRLVVGRPQLLGDLLDRSLATQRMLATLIGLFAAMALILAVVGLYGVMAHVTARGAAEIGVRLAFGAQPRSVVRLLMWRGVRLIAVGLGAGLAGAAASTRYVAAQLFGVAPTDPATFAAVSAILMGAGFAACAIPVWRATRADPLSVLRRA